MAAATVKRNHPIRGAFYGVILGLGLALMAVGLKVVNLDSIMPIVLVVVGVIIGIVWGMAAPAKKVKGPAPLQTLDPEPADAALSSSFVGAADAELVDDNGDSFEADNCHEG